MFTFANQAGLDMLETTLVALQDIMLDKVLDEAGRKILCSEFSKIMQQVIQWCIALNFIYCMLHLTSEITSFTVNKICASFLTKKKNLGTIH